MSSLRKPVRGSFTGGGPVRFRTVQQQDGPVLAEIAVDFGKAEPPHLSYHADFSAVYKARLGYNLYFGKLNPSGDRLRSAVEIFMPQGMFAALLKSATQIADTLTKTYPVEPTDERELSEPEKLQHFQANVAFMAVWAQEGLMDFYYIPSGDYTLFGRKQLPEIRLVPVLRITTDALTMRDFLKKSYAVVPETEIISVDTAEEEKSYDADEVGHR